ncbi:MAG: hypothetical protein ACO1QS_11685 [Verrucomicrobiota bacterium]
MSPILQIILSLSLAPVLMPTQLSLPLSKPDKWHLVVYDKLPANRLIHRSDYLEIQVNGSAGPILHVLPEIQRVKAIRVKGRYEGNLRMPVGKQGLKDFDDYVLRVGLVEPGPHKLNRLQRAAAPEWLKTVESLTQPYGVERVHFFNVAQEPTAIGTHRIHPQSKLIEESIVAAVSVQHRTDFEVELKTPSPTVAIWLSADGDDTGSSFKLVIEEIQLMMEPISP